MTIKDLWDFQGPFHFIGFNPIKITIFIWLKFSIKFYAGLSYFLLSPITCTSKKYIIGSFFQELAMGF